MRAKTLIMVCFLFTWLLSHQNTSLAEEPVNIPDQHLKTVIEYALHVTNPTPTDMLKLTTLMAYQEDIENITGLEYATNIKYLALHNNKINDISPISGLIKLEELYLAENNISDISVLSNLTDIKSLNLSCNQIHNISSLSGLIKLTWLGLQGNSIGNLSSLSNLKELTGLFLGGSNISNISPLSELTKLQQLWLSNNQISDISPLSGLTNLQELFLSGNPVNDISPISFLTQLNNLEIGQCGISDISQLSDLTNLDNLYLLDNQISDISVLSGLTNLKKLNLNGNQISDISTISNLINLNMLVLGYNQVSDISPLAVLTDIEDLFIWGNPLNFDAYNIYIPLLESYGTTVYYDEPIWRTLTSSSTTGGSVIEPGEGSFIYINENVVDINAVADSKYYFVEWTGTAVDKGKVAEPNSPETTVTMDGDYTVQANFEKKQFTSFYVDDNAPNDPGPENPDISDPDENGSPEHPFDTIQEAVEIAKNGDTIYVYPGIYTETVFFLGKAITVQGKATQEGIPVIENPDDFAVSFIYSEDSNSILKNFVITNSFMAIFIAGSSPTINNVTIINNRYGIDAYADSHPRIYNCILWNNLKDDLYNCQATYSCIERGNEGEGNISAYPLFADWYNGDYYLLSERGRFWQKYNVWILDDITSPCIDAGDPNSPVYHERIPNGGRINMGAYGGTPRASMSPYNYPDVGIAYNPVPTDSEFIFDLNTKLSWETGTNAAMFEVYFGTDQLPPFVRRQFETQFDPGELEPNTQYYWRIDEIDNSLNRATGEIWTFFTGQPAYAHNPSPPDGANNIRYEAVLSWEPGLNANYHDVYLGTSFNDVNNATRDNSSGVLVSYNQYSNNFDPSGLEFNRTYYWRVDEIHGYRGSPIEIIKGNLWSFTTGPKPTQAYNPNPANNAVNVYPDIVLSWSPGTINPDTYDIYFGTNFDDVNDATITNPSDSLVSIAQDSNYYDPDQFLEDYQTYYWRIDEADSNGFITKGEIWSFTVSWPTKDCSCFTAETPVWVDGRMVEISKVVQGQKIGKADCAMSISGSIKGLEEHGTGMNPRYEMTFESGNTITIIHSHYFMTASGEWKKIEELSAGMQLQTMNGPIAIRSVVKKKNPFFGQSYNLILNDSEQYFVGEDGVIALDCSKIIWKFLEKARK